MAKKAAPKAAAKAAPAPAPTPPPAPAPAPAPAAAAPKGKAAAPKAKKPAAPEANRPKPQTKGAIFTLLAEKNNLSKKQVSDLFDTLEEVIKSDLADKGPGVFVLPGLLKLQVVQKPPTAAKKGVNPFTGQPMTIKAKPARNIVKARPLKALRDLVSAS